jgi:glycosyltransferase involved in cell wall biosynthesis
MERPDLVEITDKYSLPYLTGLLRLGWLPKVDFRPTTIGLSCERMDDNIGAYLTRSSAGAFFSRAYMKWLYFPMCDHHIAVSSYTADELAHASRGHLKRRGVWICPPGVDCDRFGPERRSLESRARLLSQVGGSADSVILLYCGRLAPEKNVSLLLDLMERLRVDRRGDFRLLIAGDGMLREALMAEAAVRAPGLVHCLGHVSERDTLAELYANCDVFLHPNPKEPFGIAPLEAMAAGLPVLAPDSGGLTSYADRFNSWLAPPEAARFAAALYAMLDDPDERRRRVKQARQTSERYSSTAIAARYLRLYRGIHVFARRESAAPLEAAAFYSSH